MKRLLLFLALAGLAFASCQKEAAPAVALAPGEATSESISFVITPESASSVRYTVVEDGAQIPSAEDLFNKNSSSFGMPADATMQDEYVVNGLQLGTDYTVVAAAKNNIGYSEVATLAMSTATPEASVTLTLIEEKPNSVVFKLVPVNAGKVAYIVIPEGETIPEASEVLATGVEVDNAAAGQYTANGLESESSYVVVAAALDLAGKNSTLSEALNVSTTKTIAPSVGDYYYSDGTWSTEYDSSKTPIGVVFYLGCNNEAGDNQAYYKVKDGSKAMEQFHGYAVALKDASPEEGCQWSFYDSWCDPTGISVEVDDFLGYTNTLAIRAEAKRLGKEFSSSNSSYPAAWYATDGYDAVCPAPAQSSGWFLPSAGQLKYIWDAAYFNPSNNLKGWLENSFRNLGDLAAEMHTRDSEYWASNEQIDSYGTSVRAYYVCFDSSNWQPGFVTWFNKDGDCRVRSVLAF